MSGERKPATVPVSVHTAEHPNPNPPKLLHAAVLLGRADARLKEAATSLRQAQELVCAAQAEVRPGELFTHTTLRAEVLRAMLVATQEARTMEKIVALAKRLVDPVPAVAQSGGAL